VASLDRRAALSSRPAGTICKVSAQLLASSLPRLVLAQFIGLFDRSMTR